MKMLLRFKWKELALMFGLLGLLTGCYKYEEKSQISNPSYLRVFNSIPFNLDAVHAGQAQPFLCFLVDPKFDASGNPIDGAVVGDWLHTRELFSLSYAADAATALNAQQTVSNVNTINSGVPLQNVTNANYEYPGKLHVLTAPQMNGIDLSAWAQVPSGKHRILFVVRPQDNTPFNQVATTLRSNTIIDTTIDLQAGEVYTMNALATDLDNAKYGINLRKEQFVHEKFDPGRLYACFYNLSGVQPFLATDPKFPYYWYYTDTMSVSYTYWTTDDNVATGSVIAAQPMLGATNIYMSTVIRGKTDNAVFTPIPFLDRSYFFDQQGVLRTYDLYNPFNSAANAVGTMPFVSFSFGRPNVQTQDGVAGKYSPLVCTTNPASVNLIDPNVLQGNTANSKISQVNLNRVIQSGSSINIIPTVNIFEIIYNRVYLMQLQRGFDKVPE